MCGTVMSVQTMFGSNGSILYFPRRFKSLLAPVQMLDRHIYVQLRGEWAMTTASRSRSAVRTADWNAQPQIGWRIGFLR